VLLKQLPSGWNPPVIEVFDALMRRGEGGEEAGKQLYKSDIKQLVDQIHKELRKVGQTVGVGEAGGRRSGGHAPSELVDFLSSVCVTDNRGHEDVQCWVAQLMCGLVSEGVDPHNSSLIYHLRLLADKGADGRLKATSVQISTATLGKLRRHVLGDDHGYRLTMTLQLVLVPAGRGREHRQHRLKRRLRLGIVDLGKS